MTLAVIGLGSNIDDPPQRLQEASHRLCALTGLSSHRVSRVYSSPPMGPQDQPPFFNAVLTADCSNEASDLLLSLKAIEQSMGRVQKRRWGERCIDLDIIQFGELELDTTNLVIPHPGLCERLFVIQPMIDLLGSNHKVPGLRDLGTLRRALLDHSLTTCEAFELHL